jgi:hypothetical protein
LNDECNGLSNRIEEPDTKIEKKLAKIKIDFFDLFGVGGAGWRFRSFFFFNTAIGFLFFLHFL